jgi:hypothetical protein
MTSVQLIEAARRGYVWQVRELVEREGVHPEDNYAYNVGPLGTAARFNRTMVLDYLLIDCEVDVDKATTSGETPLLLAAGSPSPQAAESVKVLLFHRADPNLANAYGRCPLLVAARKGHVEKVKLLLQDARTDVDRQDHFGSTALSKAVQGGHWKVVRLLLEAHGDPTLTDNFGESPWTYWSKLPLSVSISSEEVYLLLESLSTAPTRARLLHRARRDLEEGVGIGGGAEEGVGAGLYALGLLPSPDMATEEGGEEMTEEEEKLRAVLAYVLDVQEEGEEEEGNGSSGGRQGMLKEHVAELMDMLVPAWDAARS